MPSATFPAIQVPGEGQLYARFVTSMGTMVARLEEQLATAIADTPRRSDLQSLQSIEVQVEDLTNRLAHVQDHFARLDLRERQAFLQVAGLDGELPLHWRRGFAPLRHDGALRSGGCGRERHRERIAIQGRAKAGSVRGAQPDRKSVV